MLDAGFRRQDGYTLGLCTMANAFNASLVPKLLGIGAVLGPLMTLKLRRMPEAEKMAGGLR